MAAQELMIFNNHKLVFIGFYKTLGFIDGITQGICAYIPQESRQNLGIAFKMDVIQRHQPNRQVTSRPLVRSLFDFADTRL